MFLLCVSHFRKTLCSLPTHVRTLLRTAFGEFKSLYTQLITNFLICRWGDVLFVGVKRACVFWLCVSHFRKTLRSLPTHARTLLRTAFGEFESLHTQLITNFLICRWGDSNSRPIDYESIALPPEPHRHIKYFNMLHLEMQYPTKLHKQKNKAPNINLSRPTAPLKSPPLIPSKASSYYPPLFPPHSRSSNFSLPFTLFHIIPPPRLTISCLPLDMVYLCDNILLNPT